ncbi:MAG: helix-turn-helix domain-containing protein [Ktedonobacteraceae bacterium]
MASKQRKQRQPSALSQALTIYRDKHKFTQEELAALLDVEPRTLRRWENGETVLTDTRDLKHIADRLGIPYDHLGIAPSLYIPLSIEQMTTTVTRIWSLIDDGRISEAHAIAENLVHEAYKQLATDDPNYLRAFAHMYHVAAHATSLSVRTDDVGQAMYYYQQMEYFARRLKDNTLINISLAYQGDMYRRKNDLQKAIIVLEEARDTTPGADLAARGNVMQLLARSYVKVNRVQDFDRAIKTSEEIAFAVAEQPRSTGNQYHLSHVYEEYAKGYDLLGRPQEALDYVDKAEKAQTLTKSVEILLKVVRAEILIHSGDINAGEPLAVEAAVYTKAHGHLRRLERIYALKRYLNGQALRYGRAEASLSEALEGSLEL